MTIIAVDPGKTTGFSIHVPGNAPVTSEVPWLDFIDDAYKYVVVSKQITTVVCERFVVSGRTVRVGRGDENWSAETIGALRWLCHRAGATFELQSASDAKKFAPDQRLRDVGWWTPGKQHANDASRHLLLYLARLDPALLPPAVVQSSSTADEGRT